MQYDKDILSTIRWKLTSGSELSSGESAYTYALIGDILGYPSEDMDDLAKEVNEPDDFAKDLIGKNVCLVVGHEPGGGAKGERRYNAEVAEDMKSQLEARGATVYVYNHKTKSFSTRTKEMRAGVKKAMPNADAIILLHYNGVSYESAHGHEFHYGGYPSLAEAFRDEWQKDYPSSRARQNNGILHNTNGRGSMMIRRAPAPCVLVEPFFISNPQEKEMFYEHPEKVATTYSNAVANFITA